MAYQLETLRTPPSVIIWEPMRKKWTWYTGQNAPSKVGNVRNYFTTFIPNHRGYQFTVIQNFSSLYEIGISGQQYNEIKHELERMVGLNLPDIQMRETLQGGYKTERCFSTLNEFKRFQENDLSSKNRLIVRNKYEEVKAHYNMVMEAFRKPREKTIMAFDIEVYEHDFAKMLEIGYVIIRFSPNVQQINLPDVEVVNKRHYIIKEYLYYNNKDFVPDNRYGFKFGSSETVSLKEAVEMFLEDVQKSDFLLGHCVKHDDEYLRNIGVDLSKLNKEMFDSQLVQIHKDIKPNDDIFFTRGLKKLLGDYHVNFQEKDLHNAGNDAYYTMMLFLRQMDYSSTSVNGLTASF